MKKLLVISGTTASGKTELAGKLAQEFLGELISADSRQVYKEMDIVTGKDVETKNVAKTFEPSSPNYRIESIPAYTILDRSIWMYDIVSIDKEWSVSHYSAIAKQLIDHLHHHDVFPIVVGGTGLYIKSIIEPIETLSIPQNATLREELSQKTTDELIQYLQDLQYETYQSLNNSDRYNPRRLIRKIEIERYTMEHTRKNTEAANNHTPFDILHINLTASHDFLLQRITQRVEDRIQEGAVSEVDQLTSRYGWNYPAFDAIGYKEWKTYLNNPTEANFTHAKNEWIAHELAYTKKQKTWFQKQKNCYVFDMNDPNSKERIREKVYVWYTESSKNT